MSNLEGVRFTKLACTAIRKCTAGGSRDLMDAFVAAGLIEAVVHTINKLSGSFNGI